MSNPYKKLICKDCRKRYTVIKGTDKTEYERCPACEYALEQKKKKKAYESDVDYRRNVK